MSLKEAKALVRRYLGSFPTLNLHDPQIYAADLCALLCGYPLWAAEKVITVVQDTNRFPTTRAELKPLLEDNVRATRFAMEWERKAQEQLLESRRLIAGPDQIEHNREFAKAWLDRSDPKAKQLAESASEANTARKAELTEQIIKANQRAFVGECKAAGVDPLGGVSPALLKVLAAQ